MIKTEVDLRRLEVMLLLPLIRARMVTTEIQSSHFSIGLVFISLSLIGSKSAPDNQSTRKEKATVTCLKRVFLCVAPVACFTARGSGCMFSRAWQRLHVFPRAREWLHIFPRLHPFACFPALVTNYMFSRAWHVLCDFPRFPELLLLSCLVCTSYVFPKLSTCFIFSRA